MRNKSVLMRLFAVLFAFTILAAACGDDDNGDEGGSGGGGGGGGSTTEKKDDGGGGGKTLAGLKGTTPLVDLDQTFKDRLLEQDDSLKDFNYAAES